MNTRNSTSRHSSTRRDAGLVPVKEICEICCIALCRIVVPRLSGDFS